MKYIPGHGWVGTDTDNWSFLKSLSSKELVACGLFGGTAAAAAVYFYLTSGTSNSGVKKNSVPGLHNLGNTCYANSLLQGLASLPSISQWLHELDTSSYGLSTGFLDELKDIITKLNTLTSEVFNAGGVTSSLINHGWNISIGVEHDLYELFNVFVTTWDDELAKLKHGMLDVSLLDMSKLPSDEMILNRRNLFLRCSEILKSDAKLKPPTFGLTATELRCVQTDCGYKKVKYDPCGALSFTIPRNLIGGKIALETLMRKYFFMEVIREASCDKCQSQKGRSNSGLFKKQGFSKLPQCLIIRIERVGFLPSGQTYKLSDHVSFGETLDVRDFCFNRNKEDEYKRMEAHRSKCLDPRSPEATSRIVGGGDGIGLRNTNSNLGFGQQCGSIEGGSFLTERREAAKYRYQLRAVSEHRGVPETGHFVTYRRGIHDPHSWFLTNDSTVTRVPYSQVASSQAYLLYYERILRNRWFKEATHLFCPSPETLSL